VNNPLAAATNAVYIASSDASLLPQTRSALEIADQELRRAAHVTSRSLGFYRDQNVRTIERLARYLAENPANLPLLENLNAAVTLARSMPFAVDLWEAQHVFYDISRNLYPRMREDMERGNAAAEAWIARFRLLSENLSVRLN
jgi:hypothetical protein